MHPSELSAEIGRIHNDELVGGALGGGPRRGRSRKRARRWEMPWRRGLGEQLEAIRRRLEVGRRRRAALADIRIGRYTGARI